jgi:hypothetical protein
VIRTRALAALALAAIVAWGAPLAGLALAGRPLAAFLAFPPRTREIAQPPFDWGVFAVMALPMLAALALIGAAIVRARPRESGATGRTFPWWGWLGAGLVAAAWTASWADLVPGPMRPLAFTLLWLGYIVVMNGLAERRAGSSLLTRRTALLVSLFPLSAGFWWLFEHLNQFVNNWHYAGVAAESDWEYFLRATLPFSTVLPAVASTWAWLAQQPRLDALALPPLRGHAALAATALAAGTAALAAIGLRPDLLFPFLWVAPLLVLAGAQHLVCGETLFSSVARGDWRPILQSALAALLCGFFWELWNWGSAARWHYAIPYVQRFHLFEMPALGYAGYLPFGIECALVVDLCARVIERQPAWPLENDPVRGTAPGPTDKALRENG